MQNLTLGSLFDGIGGWLLAAKHNGVTPVWSSEIDPFPAAVTAKHFPHVKQLGDITKIKADDLEPVDIICAGSPCQDLSVAGKRAGLEGERSGLFRTAVRIVHEMRARTGKPRYFVWENVTGAFSSNKGHDFRAVLEEISQTSIPMPGSGKWANAGMVSWGNGSLAWRVLDAQYWGVPQRRKRIFLVADFAGQSVGEILFEPEGVPGDSQESEGEREGAAADARASTESTSEPLITCYNVAQPSNNFEPYTKGGGVAPTLISRMGTGGNQVPIVQCLNDQGGSVMDVSDKAATLRAQSHGHEPIVHTINDTAKTVRKLTPTECERLQGLPDGYTNIEFNGKPAPDSRRYKALGNGMAQPCADYVIQRIKEEKNNGK